MEIKARPPITPPATATVVCVLIAFPLVLFCALLVKPAPPLEDSSCPAPVVVAVAVVAVSPTTTGVEPDASRDALDVIAGSKLSLVWVTVPRSCSVVDEDGDESEVVVVRSRADVEETVERTPVSRDGEIDGDTGGGIEGGAGGGLVCVMLGAEVVMGISLWEDVELVVLVKVS